MYRNSSSVVLTRFVTDGNGAFALESMIPTDPIFCGRRWVLQGMLLESPGKRLAASNALLATVGS